MGQSIFRIKVFEKIEILTKMFFTDPEKMTETPNRDNLLFEMSDTSSVKEPDTPIFKTCKPKMKIPAFTLDPKFVDMESSGKSVSTAYDDIISKEKFVDKNRIVKSKNLMKNITYKKVKNMHW